ncbi:hypothetical protein [Streptomyces sp. NPDC002564]|uniref:hypothetical protein n=1 Tax=Streptomyces sp. NPDC002564 TaxID=3364649 RepID=UPI0036CACAB0
MADFVFNIALGRVAYYASLPAANDALVLVALESAGLEADSVLRDKDSLTDIVAGATNEQTTVGRKTLTSVTATVDDTLDRVAVDAADVSWATPSGAAVGALVVCYDPDTTGGTDADLIPLTKHTFPWSPGDGIPLNLAIADLYRSNSTT